MMRFSLRTKFVMIGLLVILNITLRFQVVSHEIGWDSFLIHIMANSLTEFGYAKWWLHPLSIFGLYPASYTSTVQFLLSGISQCTEIEMRWVIFLYCVVIGLLSMFTAYLMAGEIIDNDLFKFLAAFGFSISPAVVGYTTWTIATRNLVVVLAPLLVYLLLKSRTSLKYAPLTLLLAIFLFATHHLFYFLIPAFFAFFVLSICFKLKEHIGDIKIPEKLTPFVSVTSLIPFLSIAGFLCMFSIPFFTGRFIEYSRYAPIGIDYLRYTGILLILAIGGLVYLIFKRDKGFGEWFLLLTSILLTSFIYRQTYMQWFLPIFAIPLAAIGLKNLQKTSEKRKYVVSLVAIFLLLSLSFSAYYQFLHTYETTQFDERFIEDSTYKSGRWMKENLNGVCIANDAMMGNRIFATSETVHHVTTSATANQIYGFIRINISDFKRYPVTDETFWTTGYKGPDLGEVTWGKVQVMSILPYELNITHVVENKKCGGNLHWGHRGTSPKLLRLAYDKDCIYDCGNIKIWGLD